MIKKIITLLISFCLVSLVFAQKKDAVLTNLDAGMLSFYEENYTDAIKSLQTAEDLIYDNYTKSISQYSASIAINDLTIDYAGEDYEDLYINLFKSLSYYNLGKSNDAIVEINRFINKSKAISSLHEVELAEARKLVKENGALDFSVEFHDSALGEYLAMLYYRSIKDRSTMQSSARFVEDAFNTQKDIYNFKIPSSLKSEVAVSNNDTRVNVLCFSGLSPKKVGDYVRYSDELFFSVPALQKYKQNVNYITVTLINDDTKQEYFTELEKIEDLANVAMDTFQQKEKLYYYKALYRALAKGTSTLGTQAAGEILSDSSNAFVSAAGAIISAGSVINGNAAELTDQADLRIAQYLPARADVGGITVEPGKYNIVINYYDKKGGKILYKTVTSIIAQKGKLNLITNSITTQQIKTGGIKDDTAEEKKSYTSALEVEKQSKIHFDLGTEPDVSGNVSYGMIQYDWTQYFGSRIDLRYTTKVDVVTELEGYGNVVETIKNRTIETDFLPVVFSLGRGIDNRFIVSAGVSYQYTYFNDFAGMFDVNGLMLDEGDEGKYFTMSNEKKCHFISPKIGMTSKMPLNQLFTLNFEGFVNPIYYLIMEQNMAYHSDQTTLPFDYSGHNTINNFSTPFVSAKVSLDMFRFLRLVSLVNYQRLEFQQMDWNENFDELIGYDDIQTITTLRLGVELLSINRNNARLRGGVYWQREWNNSTYLETTTAENKFVFCIGTEL